MKTELLNTIRDSKYIFNSKNFGVCAVIAKLSSDNQDVAVSLLANTPSKGKNVRC